MVEEDEEEQREAEEVDEEKKKEENMVNGDDFGWIGDGRDGEHKKNGQE